MTAMLVDFKATQAALAALPADHPDRPALQARLDRINREMDRAAASRYVPKTRAARWRSWDPLGRKA